MSAISTLYSYEDYDNFRFDVGPDQYSMRDRQLDVNGVGCDGREEQLYALVRAHAALLLQIQGQP